MTYADTVTVWHYLELCVSGQMSSGLKMSVKSGVFVKSCRKGHRFLIWRAHIQRHYLLYRSGCRKSFDNAPVGSLGLIDARTRHGPTTKRSGERRRVLRSYYTARYQPQHQH